MTHTVGIQLTPTIERKRLMGQAALTRLFHITRGCATKTTLHGLVMGCVTKPDAWGAYLTRSPARGRA